MITNNDLFVNLRNANIGFKYEEPLFDFVVQKCNLRLSENGKNKLRNRLRLFCINLSNRWKTCNRTLERFMKIYDLWLKEEFKVSDVSSNSSIFTSNISQYTVASTSSSPAGNSFEKCSGINGDSRRICEIIFRRQPFFMLQNKK